MINTTKAYGKFRQYQVEADDFTIYFDFWDGVFVQQYLVEKPNIDRKLERAFASEAADRLYTEQNPDKTQPALEEIGPFTKNWKAPSDPFEQCLVRFRK